MNVEHLEYLKERFAVAGVETPEEWLMPIAVMSAHLLTLFLKCGDAPFSLEDLTYLSPDLRIVLRVGRGLEQICQHFDQVLSDLSLARLQPL